MRMVLAAWVLKVKPVFSCWSNARPRWAVLCRTLCAESFVERKRSWCFYSDTAIPPKRNVCWASCCFFPFPTEFLPLNSRNPNKNLYRYIYCISYEKNNKTYVLYCQVGKVSQLETASREALEKDTHRHLNRVFLAPRWVPTVICREITSSQEWKVPLYYN